MPAPALGRGWLRGLLQSIREGGVQPRDPRVKALWALLRRRQLLAGSPWAQTRLRFIWRQGLNAKPRPRTAARLLALIRNQAPLPAIVQQRFQQRQWARGPRRTVMARSPMHRLRPVAVRRVGTLRPVGRARPVRPLVARRRGR
jgi:hypothetical protein